MSEDRILALWKRKSQKGRPFFTGMSDTKQLIAFYGPDEDVALQVYENPGKDAAGNNTPINYDNPLGIFALYTSKNGNKYLKGKFEGQTVTAFINKDKKSEKLPDITGYVAKSNQISFDDFDEEDLPF